MEFEEPEDDASYEHSKSAHYYMFNRVYTQWQEATAMEKQEHHMLFIKFRFICNFARFRTIMDILWDDDVYPLIEVSQVIKSPYRVSDAFIEAVKRVIEQRFPPNLRTVDGTKLSLLRKEQLLWGTYFLVMLIMFLGSYLICHQFKKSSIHFQWYLNN